ncbi:adenosylcobinamide-GDP ribazoletransferase [Sphingomonas bacterium]|uniref:adenosylcobinamide-GDP ribazoletransferase n=1 Tax=Sphingomonas bacterium TaxID=1895847 RepID=UPI0020C6D6EA|nr:adenosylcobinamide-GDP ribazoletransferase [Sphingomonas bacterium]
MPFWAPPLLAVQFLTRVPVPWLDRLTADQTREGLVRATGWLPLVGAGIGLVTALVFAGARMLWPPLIAAIVAIGVEAWWTGAFHEDAVADFCDGFGGSGRSAEDIRRIMKDSRIGSYGALGLGLAVALRIATTAALPPMLATAAMVGAAAFGRCCAVLLMTMAPPAPFEGGLAKDIGGTRRGTPWTAFGLTIPGLFAITYMRPPAVVVAMVVAAVLLSWLARALKRRIGGSTGDCLGFAAYAGQLVMLLAVTAG